MGWTKAALGWTQAGPKALKGKLRQPRKITQAYMPNQPSACPGSEKNKQKVEMAQNK